MNEREVKHQSKLDELTHVPVNFWYDNLRAPRIMNQTQTINNEFDEAKDIS